MVALDKTYTGKYNTLNDRVTKGFGEQHPVLSKVLPALAGGLLLGPAGLVAGPMMERQYHRGLEKQRDGVLTDWQKMRKAEIDADVAINPLRQNSAANRAGIDVANRSGLQGLEAIIKANPNLSEDQIKQLTNAQSAGGNLQTMMQAMAQQQDIAGRQGRNAITGSPKPQGEPPDPALSPALLAKMQASPAMMLQDGTKPQSTQLAAGATANQPIDYGFGEGYIDPELAKSFIGQMGGVTSNAYGKAPDLYKAPSEVALNNANAGKARNQGALAGAQAKEVPADSAAGRAKDYAGANKSNASADLDYRTDPNLRSPGPAPDPTGEAIKQATLQEKIQAQALRGLELVDADPGSGFTPAYDPKTKRFTPPPKTWKQGGFMGIGGLGGRDVTNANYAKYQDLVNLYQGGMGEPASPAQNPLKKNQYAGFGGLK